MFGAGYTGTVVEMGGRYYAEKPFKDEVINVPITNFTLHLDSIVIRRFAGQEKSMIYGTITCDGKKFPFSMEKENYFDDMKLKKAISGCPAMLDMKDTSPQGMKVLREAITKFSIPKMALESDEIGWRQIPEFAGWNGQSYIMPSIIVTPEGITKNDKMTIKPKSKTILFEHIDLKGPQEDLKIILKHIVNDLLELAPHDVTYPSIAHVFLSPFISALIDKNIRRSVVFIYGAAGTGKSFFAKLLQHFFGVFKRDETLTWSSSYKYILEELGVMKDVFVLIDDYKKMREEDRMALTSILHLSSENAPRGRLGKNLEGDVQKAIAGNILITGEKRPQVDISDIARCLILEITDWNVVKKQAIGKRCLAMQQRYCEVMADFIHWTITSDMGWQGNLEEKIEAAYSQITDGKFDNSDNEMRILNSLGMNLVMFSMFVNYLEDRRAISAPISMEMKEDHVKILKRIREYMNSIIEGDSPDSMFCSSIQESIMSGRAEVLNCRPEKHIEMLNAIGGGVRQFKPIIGFYDDGDVYLLKGEALKILFSYVRDVRGESIKVDESEVLRRLERRKATTKNIAIGGAKEKYIVIKASEIGYKLPKSAQGKKEKEEFDLDEPELEEEVKKHFKKDRKQK